MVLDFDFGGLWLWHRQWHMPAGRDHVELAWKQHHETTRMANAASDASRVIAGTPVEIGARRSHDRRSSILCNHQAAEGGDGLRALNRQSSFDEERRPVCMQPVDGN